MFTLMTWSVRTNVKLLMNVKMNKSVLKQNDTEDDIDPSGLESRCVGGRNLGDELNDVASEACDWRITPHA